MPSSPKTIAIVAGEASGDMYGADITTILKQRYPDTQFYGVGGQLMQTAGVDIEVDLARVGVMGFIEVLRHFGIIRRAFRGMQAQLRERRPDLLILIDYPGFNLRLARYAQKLGIKVLYYISPQIWAWKAKRIHTIKHCVDHMAVILPFEKAIYEQAGVPASFVGHPLVERIKTRMSETQARVAWNCRHDSILIGLLPGSRLNEIQRLLPMMLETAEKLLRTHPDCEFLLPLATTLLESEITPFLAKHSLPIHIIHDATYDVMKHSRALMVASGTATLEACLLGTPMVITYKTSRLSYEIIKRLIQIQHIGLCNILVGRTVVPELIQHEATSDRLTHEMQRYLDDAEYYQNTKAELKKIGESLHTAQSDISMMDLIGQLGEFES